LKFILNLLKVVLALLSMISVIGIMWYLGGGYEGIIPVLLWVAVLVISIFLWIYLSQIKNGSKIEAPNAQAVTTMMADSVKVILGAISLIAAFISTVGLAFSTVPSKEFFVFLVVFLSTPLLLLPAVGIRKLLYLIIIPAMAAPIFVDRFVYKYDHYNDELSITLVFASAIISYLIIKKYYSKKHIEKG